MTEIRGKVIERSLIAGAELLPESFTHKKKKGVATQVSSWRATKELKLAAS